MGKLTQLTRDQTLVNRLVELGQITAEEAENHPRKNELQQAIGGRSEVEPAVYSAKVQPGDWVLVTSDGLINHIKNSEIQEMFQLEAAYSADVAARRLVNFANLRGATDNTTVVVIRCVGSAMSFARMINGTCPVEEPMLNNKAGYGFFSTRVKVFASTGSAP